MPTNLKSSTNTQYILGIETSCDETAASVITYERGLKGPAKGEILSNIVGTQFDMHEIYGGIVPEIAARAHIESLDHIIQKSVKEAGITFDKLTAIAATGGPGLIGGLLIGLTSAKTLALHLDIPFIAVNHLAAHALTIGLTDQLAPPYLLLLVSGGHSQFIFVGDVGHYTRLGSTIDDALGEAFDKTAKLLGLGFPGGPEVEKWALKGDPSRFDLPIPMKGRKEPHFSFSGLKTALRQKAEKLEPLDDQAIADLCASFQQAACLSVADRLDKAFDAAAPLFKNAPKRFVAAGGVAANKALRQVLEKACTKQGADLIIPPPALCTDNGAMIAWAGAEMLARGTPPGQNFKARSRWPLDEKAAPVLGSGKAGVKA